MSEYESKSDRPSRSPFWPCVEFHSSCPFSSSVKIKYSKPDWAKWGKQVPTCGSHHSGQEMAARCCPGRWHLPPLSKLSFFVGNWGRRKEEGGKRRARDLHPRAQMAPRVMTATPPRSLSPQLGPWRRLSVKMKNGSEVLFSFAFDFSVTIGLTFPCLYNACWIYCISHSICLGEIGLNLKKAPQSKSNEYSQMPAVVDKSTNPW